MEQKRFDELVKQTLDQIKDTLLKKQKEYVRERDPLHIFNEGARLTGRLREQVLDGFKLKHDISVADMVRDLEQGILPSEETVNEKFGDILIYTIIKKISILDRIDLKSI